MGGKQAIQLEWQENGRQHSACWRSENGSPPPRQLLPVDDTLKADAALRLLREGTGLIWRGDYHNARQLLSALTRRLEARSRQADPNASLSETFHRQRMMQGQRMRLLGLLLIPLEPGHRIPLRRAPDVQAACTAAWGAVDAPYLVSLRELQGAIGAWEWRQKGVPVAALDARIHPHYGVFSPVRGEYIDLVAQAPLPATDLALDIGTGTGVLAAVLARRGVQRVIATDMDQRALDCARENLHRLGLDAQVDLCRADLFPQTTDGQPLRAPLIVCNPPWLPGKPSAALEHAIYDPDSRMLRSFIKAVPAHVQPGGEAWLIMSDLAERLGLRAENELMELFRLNGLRVLERLQTRPQHKRSQDSSDPLHAARSAEITSLWRLALA